MPDNLTNLTACGLSIFLLSTAYAFGQPVQDHYPSGPIRSTGLMEEGRKIGKWLYYYPTGELNAIEHFENGKLHGEVLYHYRNGQVEGREVWKDGI